ncbi:MAG: hypothetical protein K8S23_14410 [Candidatus Cloacimonetes bacterium]|nr:hypothetical protein [Candidatus Cloacimonadota bacterium]
MKKLLCESFLKKNYTISDCNILPKDSKIKYKNSKITCLKFVFSSLSWLD